MILKYISPNYWRKRKALRILNHAKFHVYRSRWGNGDWEAVGIITGAIIEVMDERAPSLRKPSIPKYFTSKYWRKRKALHILSRVKWHYATRLYVSMEPTQDDWDADDLITLAMIAVVNDTKL